MSGELQLQVQPREAFGKSATRKLRRAGVLPAVVYGMDRPAVSVQVDRRELATMLREGSGENTIFLLQLAGSDERRHTMVKDLQVDPLSHRILHVDFQRIDLAEKVKVRVPVELVGVAEGVKNEGGMVDFISREVEVECLPTAIPESLVIDISELHVGQHAEVGDLDLPEGVEVLDEEDKVLLSIAVPRAAVEAEEEAEELLLESEQEEPEVIGRGKEEEGEEGASED